MRRTLLVLLMAVSLPCWGATWREALGQMSLVPRTEFLHRTNCARVVLGSFRPTEEWKGLVFLPGAVDELYMFKRASARVSPGATSLLEAISALESQTRIRVAPRGRLLLLHTEEDLLEPEIEVKTAKTRESLEARIYRGVVVFNDRDWPDVRGPLSRATKLSVRPLSSSRNSWHFYRCTMAWGNVNGWEALEMTALSGKTRVVIDGKRAEFECDMRPRKTPPVDAFPSD